MGIITIIVIAMGLSMDAFAVSVSNGMAIRELKFNQALKIGIFFGGFQALMPLIGWAVGFRFKDYIISIDHWIAFVLLAFIGIKMIREAFENEKTENCSCVTEIAVSCPVERQGEDDPDILSLRCLLVLAVATSIDALAVGVSFAFLKVSILQSASIIGLITLGICVAGVYIGKLCGDMMKKQAEVAGGVVLILIGLKILIEHLFFQ